MFPDSDKEDSSGTSKQGLVVAPKQMSSGLGSLVASYGSMTESDSDEEPQGEFATCLCVSCVGDGNSFKEVRCLSSPSQLVCNVTYLNPLSCGSKRLLNDSLVNCLTWVCICLSQPSQFRGLTSEGPKPRPNPFHGGPRMQRRPWVHTLEPPPRTNTEAGEDEDGGGAEGEGAGEGEVT